MGLRLGTSEKIQISKGGSLIRLDIYTIKPITNGVRLLSSEDYTLKDSRGIYITTKEDKE